MTIYIDNETQYITKDADFDFEIVGGYIKIGGDFDERIEVSENVDVKFFGEIRGGLTVSDSAQVTARNILGTVIVLDDSTLFCRKVNGNIFCENSRVFASGEVFGDVNALESEIEINSNLTGSVDASENSTVDVGGFISGEITVDFGSGTSCAEELTKGQD